MMCELEERGNKCESYDLDFLMAQQPAVGQGFLIIEASLSHSDTPHSVRLLCTSYQLVTEISTSKHTTLTKDRHPCPQRDSNP